MRANQVPQQIPTTWPRKKVFSSDGLFLLTDVCRYLPFTPEEVLQISRRRNESSTTSGVVEISDTSAAVDLQVFIPWAAKVWLGEEGFQKRLRKGRSDV